MAPHARVSRASTKTSPAVGSNRRLTSLKVVVFPQPDSPKSTRVSPRRTLRLRSSMIGVASPGAAYVTRRKETTALSSDDILQLGASKSRSVPPAVVFNFKPLQALV